MTWDYIIVGAGSAGCVLANQLSADVNAKVLLIEAGGSDRNPLQRIPILGSLMNIGNEKTDWLYQTQPDPSRNNRTEMCTRGKILGGSSSINGMIYVRGARVDFDRWAELGNVGWSYDDVLPIFIDLENHEFANSNGKHSPYYGLDGLLSVQQEKRAHPLAHVFVSACSELNGVRANPDYNGEDQEGACILTRTQSNRIRHSSSQAFLTPIKHRKNLTVMTNTLVTKVLLSGKKAVGVCVSTNNGKQTNEILCKEVILSGGAINSPQLLMLSGIGPKEHLSKIGVSVLHDLPGVGKNLQDHPSIKLLARVNVDTPSMTLSGKIKATLSWLIYGGGPLMGGFQALAFLKTTLAEAYPDIQIHMGPYGAHKDNEGEFKYADYPCITLLANVNRSKSRGEIKLMSTSPYDSPAIYPNMISDNEDLKRLTAAGKLCRKLLQSKSLKPYVEEETCPGPSVQTDEQWEQYVRENTTTAYHPSGTCKMGVDALAVVDPQLRVHGIDNLRVIDGSIIPTIVSGNINAACMMIGQKGADMIRAERGNNLAVKPPASDRQAMVTDDVSIRSEGVI